MMDLALVAVVLTLLGFLFYKWSTAKFGVLQKRGITAYSKPVPLFGNITLDVFTGKSSFFRLMLENHLKFKNSKVSGFFSFRDPIIIIRDVEMIKQVCIKDFDNFTNHQNSMGDSDEEILSKSLIMLKNRKWKEMRSTLSPVFTGNKMRAMFTLINECCIEATKHLTKEMESSGNTELNMEMKDFFTRYTNDVIASAAFGIKINSFQNKDNEFFTIGSTITQFRGWALIRAFLVGMMPKLMKLLRVKVMDEKRINYFKSLVYDAMLYRKKHNILRPDMIHLLMEAQRQAQSSESVKDAEEHAEFQDDDLLAQCLLFFFAGFETVSTCLCFTIYELAVNPIVQDLLYKEVLETKEELNGEPISYDKVMGLRYLDMVLSESLRKWPPAIMTDRKCSADYTLKDDENNVLVEMKKDDLLFIPILGMQNDPEHFPEPQKFDPERFSEDRKHEIQPNTYLPFGIGPRACIGNRFALMETKALIYHIISAFQVVPGEKTPKDMLTAIRGFQMMPEEKFPVKFLRRP